MEKDCYSNLNIRGLPDNRKFWKTIKLYFSNEGLNSNMLLLIERDKLVYNENKFASVFNNYLISII